MKTIKFFSIVSLVAVLLSGCTQAWLDSEPTDSTLTQEQFDELEGSVEGQVLGLYSLLTSTSSSHDSFGQKTIDLVTDLIASDVAMTAKAYGWFTSDAQLTSNQSAGGRNSYFWSYHYFLIKNCNVLLKRIDKDADRNLTTDSSTVMQANYAQALAMRAYAYSGLYYLYVRTPEMVSAFPDYGDLLEKQAFPFYDEYSSSIADLAPVTVQAARDSIIKDFETALKYFDKSEFRRSDKLYLDGTVTRALLAKFYLQIGENQKAYDLATQVISESDAEIIPMDELLTDGFNDYSNKSWMWGSNTIVTNKGALCSFFAHMDVYTYGYAKLGAAKAIDEAFYTEITTNHAGATGYTGDMRAKWFRSGDLVPYAKFFSEKCDRAVVAQLDTAKNPEVVAKLKAIIEENVDRDWFSDLVYMRIEEMYLVASEAAARLGNTSDAIDYLYDLVSERYDDPALITAVENMTDVNLLLEEIKYNWRAEFWGEGKSLQTMKRFNYKRKRGSNHFDNISSAEIDPNIYGHFDIPYAEMSTNTNASEWTNPN